MKIAAFVKLSVAIRRLIPVSLLVLVTACAFGATPLTTLEYTVTGQLLRVSPSVLAVPKGIAGSLLVTAPAGELTAGAHIEAVLRGPAFPEPRRLVGPVNEPLILPAINLVGDYRLDSIRLVDSKTGATRAEGTPSSVPVQVFDEVLVSRVTSRPLTLAEIQDKGIYIDEANFRAVEFEVAFVLDGKTIPITFPVIAPKFTDSTEIIPAAELEAKLKEAAVLNQQIATEVVQLPPEFETTRLNIQVQGVNFQAVDDEDKPNLSLTIPPIPALMVIPGNIGYLNQFFSVQIFTENAAPRGSGLMVSNVLARLVLPPGPDMLISTNYVQPGDDPLRFARIGPEKIIKSEQPIVRPGPDGEIGTTDDLPRLNPGDAGQAEFLVEGLQEGLHVMDLDLTGDLWGLPAGMVRVKGKAAGSVLVRNPRFSFAFSHPRTVRTGEPYQASVTILNTGITPANLVRVTLNRNSISGAVLEPGQPETVELGTILPGQTATATYRLRAQRTGSISFSNLTTSDDSTVGRFRLSMGVDERGVALSPDTLAMPSFVEELPPSLLEAANRVLGQALSIATAGQLPTGVVNVARSTITRRVLELAEAGQRIRYGDPLERVLPDLLLDWQGSRFSSAGFDQILRETQAGAEWRAALIAAIESASSGSATERLVQRAPDLAGLGRSFVMASGSAGSLTASENSFLAERTQSSLPENLIYMGTNGVLAAGADTTNRTFTWVFTNATANASLAVLVVRTNGTADLLRWQISNAPAGAIYRFDVAGVDRVLSVDRDGNGTVDDRLAAQYELVRELPPTVIAVEQDLSVVAGRPASPCVGPNYANYGTVVAVVFSKPMTQETAGRAEAYLLDNGNGANSAQIQPSGRVALLNLREGISAIKPRRLIVSGATDARGNAVTGVPKLIRSVYPETELPFTAGVSVKGRVLRGDGTTATNVPVTLTYYDRVYGPSTCEEWTRRASQVMTDAKGNFALDFVMAGIPYSISATDTSGLSEEAIQVVLQSTINGAVDRQHLENLANSPQTRDTLLGLFAAGSLPQAIARVEGVDRAVVNDFVGIGSVREGQEVPIALRFRGRGNVVGVVLGEDGQTPVANAAVNLFPDPDSREQGRGIFSDANGQFAFFGVPLGVYTVDVKTSDKRGRTVAGLLESPGQTASLTIALPSNPEVYASFRGRVYEADNITPHPQARVFIGRTDGAGSVRDVVRIVNADEQGYWEALDIPIRDYDLVAVTFDGKRKGVRYDIMPAVNQVTFAGITLEAVTRVFGRVQFEDGGPAPNALVAGGTSLVRADANGNFELQGVPVGSRQISAGLERNPASGIDFPRLGTATANIIAGQDNFVVVRLRSAGRIFGKVMDAQGKPMPGIRVAIPIVGGFFWTDADSNGNYSFENLGLGNYTLSAPANATAPQLNERELIEQIRSGDEDQILAAFEEAVRVFVGADDPLITGEHQRFRPSTWGFTTARLSFDGQSSNADIRFIPQGSVSGRVLNHQGVPIGARVRLTGLGPSPSGEPTTTIRGERDSDPATGEFSFPLQLLAGPWTVQVASPFYPEVLSRSGFTTAIDPDVRNVELRFSPIRETNGRIAGRVYNPDGTLASSGVRVKIDFSADYEIQTDTNGFFDTQILLPANRGYNLEAFDPVSGLRGRASIGMTPGITNIAEIRLISRSSSIVVRTVRAGGQPAAGAVVELSHGSYPYERNLSAIADTNGIVTFANLWEGSYAAYAAYMEGSTRVSARAGTTLAAHESGNIELRLSATGNIEGTFVKTDRLTPVEAAQIAIGNIGFATTDAAGRFRFEGVPLGTYRLVTADPVTGARASGTATITLPGQTENVLLVEGLRGEVNGFVRDSYGVGFAPGAKVTIQYSDGLTPAVTITTGPDGRFSFPGSPMGDFSISARHELPSGMNVSGTGTGRLQDAAPVGTVTVDLTPLAHLPILVLRPDGTNPAPNTRISLAGVERDTDNQGRALFTDLRLGNHALNVISRTGGELRSGISLSAPVINRGSNGVFTVVLPGVGVVNGTVVGSDGASPIQNAEVILTMHRPPFAGTSETALTDAQGRFTFVDIATGPYVVTAAKGSLAAARNGVLNLDGDTNVMVLRLGDSGAISGRLVRADGITPAGGLDVWIDYASQSQNPGRAFFRTAADGRFEFVNIPVGAVTLSSAAPAFGGLLTRSFLISTNSQSVDLGNLLFDEALPTVVAVAPTNGAVDIAITNVVQLFFSEALATNSIDPSGIFIRASTGRIASVVSLLPDTNGVDRIVEIRPLTPLVSKRVYEVVVLSGDLNVPGNQGGRGPRDLAGRILAAPFSSRFSTADNDPPVLLSLFPSNAAVQIDPRAVPRLSFNEPLRETSFTLRLYGPAGAVAGQADLGINRQVLTFVPATELLPNTSYTLVASNVFDLAGNRAQGEPFISRFSTLDTVGPLVALRVASNASPVAGYMVPIEAVLLTNEPGVMVHFTQDLNPIGVSTNAPFTILARMPSQGTTTLRAIATDANGNDGPIAELTLAVLPDLPPSLVIVSPSHGTNPVASGTTATFVITAQSQGELSGIIASVSGAGLTNRFTTNASSMVLHVQVPQAAIAGERIEVAVQALDRLGRSSEVRVFTLPVEDGTAPVLTILSPANNAALTLGEPLTLSFVAHDNSTNLSLSLDVSGDVTATRTLNLAVTPNQPVTNSFTIALTNAPPAGGVITAALTATDAAGQSSTSQRTFLLPAEPPSITFVRVQPLEGPIRSGSTGIVEVLAASPAPLRELKVDVSGAAHTRSLSTNGRALRVQFSVREDALATEQIVLSAEAIDLAGRSSGTQRLLLPVADGTDPVLAFISPAEASLLNPPQPLVLRVASLDNSTNLLLNLVVTGAISYAESRSIATTANTAATNVFNVPLTNSPPAGGSVTVVVTATDQATNSVTILRRLFLPGAAPTIDFVRVEPASGPLLSGSEFIIDLEGSVQGVLSNFSAQVTGPVTSVSVSSNASTLRVRGRVISEALPGSTVRITSELIDGIGRSSGIRELTIPIADGTRPSLAFLSPIENTILSLLEPLEVELLVADNSELVSLEVRAVGNLGYSNAIPLTLVPNQFTNLSFVIPITNPPALGGPVTVWAIAQDSASNLTTLARTFWLPGPDTTVYWNRRALGQRITCTNSTASYTWPNNNLWSQSSVFGDPCGTGSSLEVEPSNWSTPAYPNATNLDVFLTGLGGTLVDLNLDVALHSLTIQPVAGLNVRHHAHLSLQNLIFQGDGEITESGCCSIPELIMTNGGYIVKSGGTNLFRISPDIRMVLRRGTLSVASGTLLLPGSDSSYENSAFNVAPGASIALVPANHTAWLSGTNTGTGVGAVTHRDGTLGTYGATTFNFAPGVFQWAGGFMDLNAGLTNAGDLTYSALAAADYRGVLYNSGSLRHVTEVSLGLRSGAQFVNLPSGTYWLQAGGGLFRSSCCSEAIFENRGTIVKTSSTNESVITVRFHNVGGNVDVRSGTLTLKNDGASLGGQYTVAQGATLDVTGGERPSWSGLMTGSGDGTVALTSGTLTAAGATLAFSGDTFKWTGGNLVGPATNIQRLNILGDAFRRISNRLINEGIIQQGSSARLAFNSGAAIDNLLGGTYRVLSDSGMYVSDCCTAPEFNNFGVFEKLGGNGNYGVDVVFNNFGTVRVNSGTVSFQNGGLARDSQYLLGSGTAVFPAGGHDYGYAGRISATGPGRILHLRNRLVAAPEAQLEFPEGVFEWSGGTLTGPLTNAGFVTLTGTNTSFLQGVFENRATLRHAGSGLLGMATGSKLWNRPGALYDFASDSAIHISSCCTTPAFYNQGILRKSAGAGHSTIQDVDFVNLGGEIQVLSGTLSLRNDGSSEGGTLTVSHGAILDLTGGASPRWAGLLTGGGAGRVELSSGRLRASSLTFAFPNDYFHWTGGTLEGTSANTNYLTLSGTADRLLTGALTNNATIRHIGAGRLGMNSASTVENRGLYSMEVPSSIFVSSCCTAPSFLNLGRFERTGPGMASIDVPFHNLGGQVAALGSSLVMANDGSSSNGLFIVSDGGIVDVTGGRSPTWAGVISGQGTGTVSLASGVLRAVPNLVLSFEDNLFRWSGGILRGLATNNSVMMLDGQAPTLDGRLENIGRVRHQSGSFALGSGSTFGNHASGVYFIEADGSINVGWCCTRTHFVNSGTVHKVGGTNVFTINVPFENLGGTVVVDTGKLVLANDGVSHDGSFQVRAGAVLDITGGSSPTWSGRLSGTGEGRAEIVAGTFAGNGAVLDFAPGLLHWTGGNLAGTITNTGTLNISGTTAGSIAATFYNSGRVVHTSTAALGLASGVRWYNLQGAEFVLTSSGGIYQSSCCTTPSVINRGTFRKTGATDVTISVPFENLGGNLAVDQGALSLSASGFSVSGGLVSFNLGGRELSQYGRLSVNGAASLNGGLQVTLSPGFIPQIGDQFRIVTASSTVGVFTNVSIPAGIAVSYDSTGVSLVVTGRVSVAQTVVVAAKSRATMIAPGRILFKDMPGSFAIWSTTNLTSQKWELLETITVTNSPRVWEDKYALPARQRFYRVVPLPASP